MTRRFVYEDEVVVREVAEYQERKTKERETAGAATNAPELAKVDPLT